MKKLNFSLILALSLISLSWPFTTPSVSAYQFELTESQLTTDPYDQFDPSISGTIAVYSDRRNADADTYYYDIDSDQEVRINTGNDGDQLLNDVSGNLIVFTDYSGENADIVIYDIESGIFQQLFFPSNQRRPAISGNLVVYEDDRNGTNYDIYLYDLDAQLETQLTYDPGHQRKPAISGSIVVWEDFRNGNADVYMMDVSGQPLVPVQITSDASQEVDPDIDGNIIVYGSNRASIGDVYLYRIDDGTTVAITETEGYERNPAVSGDHVSYESYLAGDSDIWLYSISLDVSERATLDPAEQYLHDLSANRVVYTDNRNDNLDIYLAEFEFLSDIDVSPLAYDFGDVELGAASSQIVTVTNQGAQPFTVSAGLQPGSSPDYVITADPSGLSVEPGNTVDVQITFSPALVGISTAVLEISSDVPNPTVIVQFSGNGVPAEDPPEQQIADILDFIDQSVEEGTLTGSGNGNSAPHRLNALINMIESAGDLIAAGDLDAACDQLRAAYRKCDGEPRPPDFVAGDAAEELALMITELMVSIGCGE